MKQFSKQMGQVVGDMESVLSSMDPERINKMMDKFEKQFENLDVGACGHERERERERERNERERERERERVPGREDWICRSWALRPSPGPHTVLSFSPAPPPPFPPTRARRRQRDDGGEYRPGDCDLDAGQGDRGVPRGPAAAAPDRTQQADEGLDAGDVARERERFRGARAGRGRGRRSAPDGSSAARCRRASAPDPARWGRGRGRWDRGWSRSRRRWGRGRRGRGHHGRPGCALGGPEEVGGKKEIVAGIPERRTRQSSHFVSPAPAAARAPFAPSRALACHPHTGARAHARGQRRTRHSLRPPPHLHFFPRSRRSS
jgi:hypothetical protein